MMISCVEDTFERIAQEAAQGREAAKRKQHGGKQRILNDVE